MSLTPERINNWKTIGLDQPARRASMINKTWMELCALALSALSLPTSEGMPDEPLYIVSYRQLPNGKTVGMKDTIAYIDALRTQLSAVTRDLQAEVQCSNRTLREFDALRAHAKELRRENARLDAVNDRLRISWREDTAAFRAELTAALRERDQIRLMLEEAVTVRRQTTETLEMAWAHNRELFATIERLRAGREQALEEAALMLDIFPVEAHDDDLDNVLSSIAKDIRALKSKQPTGTWNPDETPEELAERMKRINEFIKECKPAVTGEQNAATTATSTEDSVRTCAESSGRSVAAPESRSILRRKAAQNGEPAPEFPPAVTGEKEGA